MKKVYVVTLVLPFLFLAFALTNFVDVPKVYATNPSTVADIGLSDYSWGFQGKSFRDEIYNYTYQFYCSSTTNICYKSSLDGETWGSEYVVRAGVGHGFSLWYDGGSYVHYVYAVPDYGESIYYRRGTLQSGGSISWGTEYTVYNQTDWYPWQPTIAVDSNNYPYVFMSWEKGTTYCRLVIKSANNNGVWSTASGYPMNLTVSDSSVTAGIILPLLSSKMYAIYYKTIEENEYHYGRLYNGSSWQSEELIDETNAPEVFSAVARDDEIHMVFGYSGVKYINYTSGSWGTSETIVSGINPIYLGAFGIEDDTSEFYVYYSYTGYETDYRTYYYHGASGNWGVGTDICWEYTPRGEEFSCFRKSWGGYHSCTMPDYLGNLEFWYLGPSVYSRAVSTPVSVAALSSKGLSKILIESQFFTLTSTLSKVFSRNVFESQLFRFTDSVSSRFQPFKILSVGVLIGQRQLQWLTSGAGGNTYPYQFLQAMKIIGNVFRTTPHITYYLDTAVIFSAAASRVRTVIRDVLGELSVNAIISNVQYSFGKVLLDDIRGFLGLSSVTYPYVAPPSPPISGGSPGVVTPAEEAAAAQAIAAAAVYGMSTEVLQRVSIGIAAAMALIFIWGVTGETKKNGKKKKRSWNI
jgi:hypothetical protein